ncbi:MULTISPECIES: hypothetical protein [Spirosoma]|uniref:DUF3575 domain-containing protein n=1 Tax=Spirosoma sordidisoli TaxID=2502893 RepID=A0A4V1RW79_9BACT|nr:MULTISPECIES: hypothetical protein [Spirosoma]RYC69328.1 hypothetical protein EQG79_11995 [Spirosoma sordidisoli]
MMMARFCLYVFFLLVGVPVAGLWAQTDAADTLRPGQNERPDKPKLIVETDQRFFYLKNADQPLLRNPVNVWGARAGLLLPVNIKVGVGYYFTNQSINEPWDEFDVSRRRLQYATVYVEPYFFRRRFWELSTLVEVGLGSARYEMLNRDTQQPVHRRTVAVPLSVGLSASVKLPVVFGIKPLRWFGVNFMAGYRYTLHEPVPLSESTLNGLFYSISPAIFLDRIYQDIGGWRKGRNRRKG